jgi:hypothetical protein
MPWPSMNCASSYFSAPCRGATSSSREGSYRPLRLVRRGVSARPERLREIEGLGDAAIVELKIVETAAKRLAKSSIEKRPSLSSFAAVVV